MGARAHHTAADAGQHEAPVVAALLAPQPWVKGDADLAVVRVRVMVKVLVGVEVGVRVRPRVRLGVVVMAGLGVGLTMYTLHLTKGPLT